MVTNPDVELSPALSVVPVINTTLLFRDSLEGEFQPLCVALTLASSALYGVLSLWAASRILAREEVATGGEVKLLRAMRFIFGKVSGRAGS